MKNYFKKFSIMFVMALMFIGIGIIQNGTIANAATVGDKIQQKAESGWNRFDNNNSAILYNGFEQRKIKYAFNKTDAWGNANSYIRFNFNGSKLRIVGVDYSNASNNVKILIDGKEDKIDCTKYHSGSVAYWQIIQYENIALEPGNHDVIITNLGTNTYYFDCIETDGNLIVPSISLDDTTLLVDTSKQLIATSTLAAIGMTWTSSDSSVATVDLNGKVTAVKEGQATITAKIKGTDIVATCIVTVIPKGEDLKPPIEPEEPQTDGSKLYIELVDGNIKQYDVDESKINDFINWYNDRDNDDSKSPYFKFTSKDGYKDYVVHDKIDWFEVR